MISDFVLALKYLFDMQDSTTLLQRPTSDQMTWNRYFKTIKWRFGRIRSCEDQNATKKMKLRGPSSRTINGSQMKYYEFIVSHSSLLVRQVFCSKRFVTLLFFWHSSKQLSPGASSLKAFTILFLWNPFWPWKVLCVQVIHSMSS